MQLNGKRLPIGVVVERRSHDYQRHRRTSLFAALDIATGRVIGPSSDSAIWANNSIR